MGIGVGWGRKRCRGDGLARSLRFSWDAAGLRKRPEPDVIGHQLTVFRARASLAAAAVAVAEVLTSTTCSQSPDWHGYRSLKSRNPRTPLDWVLMQEPLRGNLGFDRDPQQYLGKRECRLQEAPGNAFPKVLLRTSLVSPDKFSI